MTSASQPARRRGAQRRVEKAPANVRGAVSLWTHRLLVGVCCVVISAGTWQAVDYLLSLDVRRIAISGSLENIDAAQIESRIAPEVGSGFLLADLDAIRRRLEAMPWVHVAQVRRHWPDTIGIHITEQQPVARWGRAGYLNHEGQYFPTADADDSAGLPLLEGPEGSAPELMRRYLRLESMLSPLGLEIARLSADELEQLTVVFDNGVSLSLGNHAFAPRLQRFAVLWERELRDHAIEHIDMRYEHGAAVREKETQIAMTDHILRGDH